jgi:fructose-1,6-bisphosphatase
MDEIAYAHLQVCINYGIDEERYWLNTLAENMRFEDGYMWRLQSKAQFDYALANLIGVSCARIMSKDIEMPKIEDVYDGIFEKEEEEVVEEQQQEIATQNSINRFMEFALKHNAMMREEEGNLNDSGTT